MKAKSSGKYKKAVLLFVTVLLVFLIGTNILLVSKLRSQLSNEDYIDIQNEMELVALFLREPLLMNNYDEVEQFLLQWRDEHNYIVSIEAVMPNGFKLVESTDTAYATNIYELQKNITYLDKELISIRVVKKFTHEGMLRRLQLQLIIGSTILTFLFGLILWLTIRKFALTPLEIAKQNLEEVVRERTKTLEDSNNNLITEIDIRKKTQTQLKAKIKELEEFYDMAVGREIKMKTLKEEIAKLKSELKSRG